MPIGSPLKKDTTDASGKYLFTGLSAGNYVVKVVTSSIPSGSQLTTKQDIGTNDAIDSDLNPSTGLSDKIVIDPYDATKKEQVHTTLAKQLALYVTIYSPLQMAADLPENYEKHLDAFQFIKDVPADWQESRYIEAEPGDYITVARKDKNSEKWFLGAITDENARQTEIKLDFLSPNKKYEAVIYQDGKDADWEKNPKSYAIKTIQVTSKSKIKLLLAKGGGTAISFKPIN